MCQRYRARYGIKLLIVRAAQKIRVFVSAAQEKAKIIHRLCFWGTLNKNEIKDNLLHIQNDGTCETTCNERRYILISLHAEETGELQIFKNEKRGFCSCYKSLKA